MTDQPTIYLCPVDAPVQVLGGKWKLILLFYLLQEPRRNGELRRLVPTITQKMLTQQLRELEDEGLVVRTVFDQVPSKVVYSVAAGEREGLAEVLDVLCRWGLSWSDKIGARVLALEPSATIPEQESAS
ncbi:MAG: helix-turn-helix transcriptional regulator [Actinomycetia bacterium]|nr:helix-turn-helix transcriptional regulator [Actinomycetes bacterium]